MNKLLFLLILIIPLFSYSQKIQNVKTNEVVELKEKVENYCTVVLQPYRGKIDFFVGIDELGIWKLLDENDTPIEFRTIVAIMNFMHKNDWEYINNIGGNEGAVPQYFFRKKQNE